MNAEITQNQYRTKGCHRLKGAPTIASFVSSVSKAPTKNRQLNTMKENSFPDTPRTLVDMESTSKTSFWVIGDLINGMFCDWIACGLNFSLFFFVFWGIGM